MITLSVALVSVNTFASSELNSASLESSLARQSDDVKARYEFRNPKETLEFFTIKPGMKVIEVLPGGGWYSKILLPYLGDQGELVGVDYPLTLWNNFSFMTPERLEGKKTWTTTWTEKANGWRAENDAPVSAFQFAEMPDSVKGSVDAALFIRALHNLNRFNDKGGYLDIALKETYAALKPGGVVGVVQHEAREDRSDEWADGNNGYLKRSFVIQKMAEHGFEFVTSSDINANPNDLAKEGDKVWRLAPALRVKTDELKAEMAKIGESNRMTLLFKKPATEKKQ